MRLAEEGVPSPVWACQEDSQEEEGPGFGHEERGSLREARTLVKNSEVAGTLPGVREYHLPTSGTVILPPQGVASELKDDFQ